ncbi:MAG TPA: FtsX-like permease family protein [Candidatus Thermoplasmatota archaeon]|nr:FtsX-like permease family protein [Candidatus Thermoplasmatota archaeon]
MTLARELAEAEWRARRGRYVALGCLLAATAAASFLVLSVVNGLEEGIGVEISKTLGGDVRIARNETGLGDGAMIRDLRDAMRRMEYADPSATFAPRLETQGLFLKDVDFSTQRNAEPGDRAAAVLLGIDAAQDARVVELDDLVVRGEGRAAFLRDYRAPDGERLVPILVGESFLQTGNASVYNGTFSWSNVYNFSAGRIENNQMLRSKGIVVGAYATGFRMVDRLVVYAPRADIARLLGENPSDPPANVLLASTPRPEALAREARTAGYEASVAPEFRETYLGPVFVNVRVAAWAIVGLLALMTAGWMGYTLAHHVHEDRRKIATLRALGIPDREIANTYMLLGGALAGAAAVAGVVAATLLGLVAFALAPFTGLLAPSPSVVEAALLVVLSLVAGLVTVSWAVRRAARVNIREALQAP